jgi:rfaE bifunctional protein nucleotidyltransferase chain/domain/rfaE bifunctional protein kinase chain/domain
MSERTVGTRGTGHLVVVGDCLLDIDLAGTADRLCPDAPAPVLDLEDERIRPGGAGLAARLAATDGVDVTLVTCLAADPHGELLRAQLTGFPVVAGPSRAATPVKTRLLAAGRSIARVDRGGRTGAAVVTAEMLDAVAAADAVLVSDYGRDLSSDERLRSLLSRLAGRIPVVWDPHPRGADPVAGTTAVTPNLAEATGATGLAEAEAAADLLLRRWRTRGVVITLGSRGALVHEGGPPRAVPAEPVAVIDPCGAGDRFASVLAARLLAGSGVLDATGDAVAASGRFLAAGGVASVCSGRTVPVRQPTHGLAAARRLADVVRAGGGTVVATGGCFDLLHAGHARTLRAAREMGDCLVVCLNSDASVRRLKGSGRPINHQRDRAELLGALGCVDAVVIFDEDGPERVLGELRPDVWVKGGDYTAETLPETELVRGWGGEVVVTPYLDGRSTTRLAEALTT